MYVVDEREGERDHDHAQVMYEGLWSCGRVVVWSVQFHTYTTVSKLYLTFYNTKLK